MYTLLIETSCEKSCVGISKDGELLSSKDLDFSYQSTRPLFIPITEQLKINSIKIKHLSSIAVGIGPGSYTGIRIGLAAAKAIAFALSIPLIGIESLVLFLPTNSAQPQLVVHNARSRGVYALSATYKKNFLDHYKPAEVIPIETINQFIEEGFTITSPHPQKILSRLNTSISQPMIHEAYPNLIRMAHFVHHEYYSIKVTDGMLQAIYLGGIY